MQKHSMNPQLAYFEIDIPTQEATKKKKKQKQGDGYLLVI